MCNNAKGVKNYVKETACEVESCTHLFELLDEACVLKSSVNKSSVNITATTKKSDIDWEAVLKEILKELGGNTFTFVLCCKQKYQIKCQSSHLDMSLAVSMY